MNNKSVPHVLIEYAGLLKDLNKAGELLQRLRDQSADGLYDSEITFMEENINELDHDLSGKDAEARAVIEQFRHDFRAYTAASLHYLCGYTWKEVYEIMGGSVDALKTCVYRAFRAQEGKTE